MLTITLQEELERLRIDAESATTQFESSHATELQRHEEIVRRALTVGLERFQHHTQQATGDNPLCVRLAKLASDYVEWMQWALGDLPIYLVATRCTEEEVMSRLPGCALAYFSGRVLDDFLDRHYLYRGRRTTLLSAIADERGIGAESEAMTVLVALMLTMDGLSQLPHDLAPELMPQVVVSIRRLLAGILMDRSDGELWSEHFYHQLIELKNVDYSRILYAAVDPQRKSPLYPLWCGYYALAQKVNDAEDYARDEAQGRPNIVSIWRMKLGTEQGTQAILHAVGHELAEDLVALYRQTKELPPLERMSATIKLGEMRAILARLGVFDDPKAEVTTPGLARIGLSWHATSDEFVQRFGADALEYIDCPVCGLNVPESLFRKQGFQYLRCRECTHIYVSPRLREEIVQQLASEEGEDQHDPFLEIQKVYAEHLCRILREQGGGPRLLDIGSGAGYLLLMARAYGFQVYGIDGAEHSVDALKPVFGERVQRLHLPHPLPWGSFDHVVMNHVMEHLYDPALVMRDIEAALNPTALFYIAVPDSDSLQFRLFGKLWDAVHPVVHPQFFNEVSLRRLLMNAGFEPLTRVRPPALVGPEQQRWMRMFRRMDGDEAGELALLARIVRSTP